VQTESTKIMLEKHQIMM